MKRFLSLERRSSFFRNTFHMLRANVIGQIVVLFSTPILSRLYSPEVFGQFAFFSAATALAVSVATFRFDWSIPNARTAGAAAALMRIGIMCILATSLALITFLGLSIISGHELFPASGICHAIFLLPLAMISSSLIELFNGWYVRVGNLETVGRVKIVRVMIGNRKALTERLAGLRKSAVMGLE